MKCFQCTAIFSMLKADFEKAFGCTHLTLKYFSAFMKCKVMQKNISAMRKILNTNKHTQNHLINKMNE